MFSMGFNGMHNNNAHGRDPDFGAIFMSNSGTKRECFKRKLFGLPSSEIKFVEKVKAGMILFLFEYDKRRLHGVFKASCDGSVNIVPNAFAASGKQFPAQVKFVPIWFCEPLPEKTFRRAIKENYFSTYKFNFGLSEKQVSELLYLFSKRKLEVEAPGRFLTRTEDLKSDRDTVGKVRRSVRREMHVETVRNEQSMGDNISPISMPKYHGVSLHHNGEDEYIGLNRSDIVVNKQGRAAELMVDSTNGYVSEYFAFKDESKVSAHESEDYISICTSEFAVDTNGYVSDYLALKDESRFTVHENKDYMDIHFRPNIMGGYSKSPSDKIIAPGDLRLSIKGRVMRQDIRETDQRMVPSEDIRGLHNYDVNPSLFYREPRPTSATQRDMSSRSNLLYNADAPDLNFNQSSSVGFYSGSKSIIETTSPSRNSERNSLNSQPHLMLPELEDMNRWHDRGGGFLNSVLYGSSRDCMFFNKARNSDPLAPEPLLHEACNSIPSLKPPSAPIPPSDIGNSGRAHEPFSSMLYDSKSSSGNNINPVALQENMSHEIALPKNNETFSSDVPWASEGPSQVQYGDSLNHEYGIGSYRNSQTDKSGLRKKKNSVFSRLSFVQDVDKQENENNARNKKHDFHASVDEVMEMVRHSQNQWMTKRMSKPSKHNKAESLSSRTQLIGSRMKRSCFENTLEDLSTDLTTASGDKWMTKRMSKPSKHKAESLSSRSQLIGSRMKDECFENTLEVLSMDLTTASGDNSNKIAEDVSFVDFKRRSKVRKLSDETEIRSSDKSEKSENLVLVQPKRRKLIRPNFNKSTTSGDKGGIDLGASQNLPLSHGSCNLMDASKSGCSLPQTEEKIKTSILALLARAELQNVIGNAHSKDKNTTQARGRVCSEGGEKATDGAPTAFHDGSECIENVKNKNAFFSASCRDKICHMKEGFCVMDSIKSVPQDTESFHSICQEHNAEAYAGRGMNAEEEILKDGSSYLQNSGNEKAPIETPHINEGLGVMDSTKSVFPDIESLHSVCQGYHLDKIICAGRGIKAHNQIASITTCCHIKEGLGSNGSVKSVSANSESLRSVCQERHADKNHEILHAGVGVNSEKRMPKDGSSSLATEFKDGSDTSKFSGNDNAPIEQKMD